MSTKTKTTKKVANNQICYFKYLYLSRILQSSYPFENRNAKRQIRSPYNTKYPHVKNKQS